MNANLAHARRRAVLAAPALAGTAASMVLTVAVVALWLGPLLGIWLGLLIGLGFDGAWLAALAYERRLSAQGEHDWRVTLVGWLFGLAATGLLVVHGLTAGAGTAAWLAVSWLPIAAKLLWWLHGLWEATEVSPRALAEIAAVRQSARDDAAVARARLAAQVGMDVVRTRAVSSAGAQMAKAQTKAARVLAGARAALENTAQTDDGQNAALTAVTAPRWELPEFVPLAAVRPSTTAALVERVASGARAAEGAAETAAQVSGPFAAAGGPAPAGVPVSTAAAVRSLLAQGETDPAEITRRVPELTGRPATKGTPATVARVIRETRAAASKTAPAPSPYL
ncbi:protein spdB [Kitasatospora sp. NPDC048194]|uniref:protein spdB n=1 Tax=Kitasatospora sp. NPDC048194 TaxID=3364045 RepID=UPI0037162F9E